MSLKSPATRGPCCRSSFFRSCRLIARLLTSNPALHHELTPKFLADIICANEQLIELGETGNAKNYERFLADVPLVELAVELTLLSRPRSQIPIPCFFQKAIGARLTSLLVRDDGLSALLTAYNQMANDAMWQNEKLQFQLAKQLALVPRGCQPIVYYEKIARQLLQVSPTLLGLLDCDLFAPEKPSEAIVKLRKSLLDIITFALASVENQADFLCRYMLRGSPAPFLALSETGGHYVQEQGSARLQLLVAPDPVEHAEEALSKRIRAATIYIQKIGGAKRPSSRHGACSRWLMTLFVFFMLLPSVDAVEQDPLRWRDRLEGWFWSLGWAISGNAIWAAIFKKYPGAEAWLDVMAILGFVALAISLVVLLVCACRAPAAPANPNEVLALGQREPTCCKGDCGKNSGLPLKQCSRCAHQFHEERCGLSKEICLCHKID
ncbi:unnamed protein product, partial [Mesorhabditis spiculigera]